jgi:hypothetical protein
MSKNSSKCDQEKRTNAEKKKVNLHCGGVMKGISSLFVTGALLVYFLLALTACTSVQRSPMSGYAYGNHESNFSRERKAVERESILAEMGARDSRASSSVDSNHLKLRSMLRRAEASLEGRRERDQYFRNKPYMRDDRERLEFLSLPSFAVRQSWLNARGIQPGPGMQHGDAIQALIDINDITIGMTKQAVRDSWGEPELTEVAGNPIYGNERWYYREETSSTDGFQTQERWVYFESGRVSGWESR